MKITFYELYGNCSSSNHWVSVSLFCPQIMVNSSVYSNPLFFSIFSNISIIHYVFFCLVVSLPSLTVSSSITIYYIYYGFILSIVYCSCCLVCCVFKPSFCFPYCRDIPLF